MTDEVTVGGARVHVPDPGDGVRAGDRELLATRAERHGQDLAAALLAADVHREQRPAAGRVEHARVVHGAEREPRAVGAERDAAHQL